MGPELATTIQESNFGVAADSNRKCAQEVMLPCHWYCDNALGKDCMVKMAFIIEVLPKY